MPLDGAFLCCLKKELEATIDSHIDKIHMPLKNEFVFSLRGRGFSKKLFVSISPNNPRVCFTSETFENPANPPMFCMLLRKHLSSGRIISIENNNSERLICFKIQATNEMGDKIIYSLILEFLGNKTNLILTDQTGRIIDAARRSDIESSERLIQPGAVYAMPESNGKTDILSGDLSFACDNIFKTPTAKLSDAVLNNVGGLSPLLCREIAFRLTGDLDSSVQKTTIQLLKNEFTLIRNTILDGGRPTLLYDEQKNLKDFSFLDITQYGSFYTNVSNKSYSDLLETFFGERDRIRRIEHLKGDLVKRIKNLIARNQKKLHLRQEELKKSANREHLRIYGELIKANIYQISKGAEKVVLQNYYDPDLNTIEIPLNSALSPALNAAKYFKDYKKACTAEQTLGTLIEECKKEGEYLDSVLYELQTVNTSAELSQIKNELALAGYIRTNLGNKKTKINTKPLRFSKNGYDILVGKNNLQNDELTTKIAAKNDLWFHTKNIHGSHVILITNGTEPDNDTVIFAATLAAFYSKAKNSNQVPVDYTPVKFVKKPSGAKPGMVIYTTNQTIFANPLDLGDEIK